jgi:hypothetical protein
MISSFFFQPAVASNLVDENKDEKKQKPTVKKPPEIPLENRKNIYQLVSRGKTKIPLNPSEYDNPPWAWDPSKMESQLVGWRAFIIAGGNTPLYLESQSLGGGVLKGIFSYSISLVSYKAELDLVRE